MSGQLTRAGVRYHAARQKVRIKSGMIPPCRRKLSRYKIGEQEFVGHLAWDDAVSEKRPGVLVVHEWWGLNDFARGRANELAKLGYVAFACDMYGGGKWPSGPDEAGAHDQATHRERPRMAETG